MSKLLNPIEEFIGTESFGGFVLLTATLAALILANSPWSQNYFYIRDLELHLSAGQFSGHASVQHVVNDGLMALFFFVVGLEIKRELLIGELNSRRKALLPVVAALGGMIAPATIFLAFNAGTTSARGWAIPMATDIAFALGVLSLLGERVPLSARVFLTSVAIIDDIGAALIIAGFYSGSVEVTHLFTAFAILGILVGCNRIGIQAAWIYVFFGMGVWLSLLGSGVHATMAGIAVAITIPVLSRIDAEKFQHIGAIKLEKFGKATEVTQTPLIDSQQEAEIHELRMAIDQVEPPMIRLQHMLHPWSTFVIMPAFAFFNAGIPINAADVAIDPLSAGILLGLVIGKPVGILLASALAIRLKIVDQISFGRLQFVGLTFLAGIGFTMALFLSNLAFADPVIRNTSTMAILLGSSLAAALGGALLYVSTLKRTDVDKPVAAPLDVSR